MGQKSVALTLNLPPTLVSFAEFSATWRVKAETDQAPSPSPVMEARTCTSYSVPAVRPVMVALVVVLVLVEFHSVHVLVPLARYCTS